jgi:hypothetical protein
VLHASMSKFDEHAATPAMAEVGLSPVAHHRLVSRLTTSASSRAGSCTRTTCRRPSRSARSRGARRRCSWAAAAAKRSTSSATASSSGSSSPASHPSGAGCGPCGACGACVRLSHLQVCQLYATPPMAAGHGVDLPASPPNVLPAGRPAVPCVPVASLHRARGTCAAFVRVTSTRCPSQDTAGCCLL